MQFDNINEKLIFYNFPVILFSLIPFFLITGPFLSDLSISLIGILFLVYCVKKKNFYYFHNKYFYFFLIFWIYLLFNSIFNNFNIDSFKISVFYFRYGVFVVAVVTFLNFNSNFKKYFFYSIVICFIVLVNHGFYQYFTESSSRTSSFFGDELILGSYLSRLWPIFFALSIFEIPKNKKLYFLFVLIFVLSEVLIFLSGDRTAFFYINLSALFVILFSKKLLKLRLFTLLTAICLITFISIINPTAKQRVFDHTLNQMNLDKDKKISEIYIFSKAHHEYYISSYKMFLDNKIIGVGVKNFRVFCGYEKYHINQREVCNTHPHNTYFQILAETGIVGFLFLSITLFYFCKYIFKHLILKFKKKYLFNDFEICILSGISIYIWPFVPTGNFFNNWLNIILLLYLPFLIWSRNQKIIL